MPLTEAQKAIREENRAILEPVIFSWLPSTDDPDYLVICERYEKRLHFVLEQLSLHHLLLNIDAGKVALLHLLHSDFQKEQAWFNDMLAQFIRVYQQLVHEEAEYARSLYARFASPLGLQGWGNDLHIAQLLREHITHPETVNGEGCYLLPPVMLTAPAIGAAEEIAMPYRFLQSHFETVLNRAENKAAKITLLTPVNTGQQHWMLVKTVLENGSVAMSRLMDSLPNHDLQDSVPFTMMTEAVKPFSNPLTMLDAISSNAQRNAYSCMDYTVQAALKEKFTEETVPERLAPIRNESHPILLRQAILARLPAADSVERNERMVTEEDIKKLFSATEVPVERLHQTLARHSSLQNEFDHYLAEKLTEFYQFEYGSDNALFERARNDTFEHFQKQFGLFAPAKSPTEDAPELFTPKP